MAYDRNDPRESARYDRNRWQDRDPRGARDSRDERGFFERAGDEIASWFGDDDAEYRRDRDRLSDDRYERGYGARDRDYSRDYGRDTGRYAYRAQDYRDRDYNSSRSEGLITGRAPRQMGGGSYDNRQSFFGSARDIDPHYRTMRQQHLDDFDRDYDQYRQEKQSRFEDDFGSWRQQRQQKRGLLGTVREHMEVVGNDDEHIGTVDRVAGDRIILAKSDPESGGVHHSLMCSSIDRVEDNRVILDCNAEEAKKLWRDESRSRALFEREDQGEMGPQMLNRSFEGTYR